MSDAKNHDSSDQVSRRSFFERLAAGAAIAAGGGVAGGVSSEVAAAAVGTPDLTQMATDAMNAGAFGMVLPQDPATEDLAAPTVKPNILMIMVDQLRIPQFWLNTAQQATLDSTIAPNMAFLRKHSVQFTEFYVAAQACSPSRSTLLTGLYTHQTGLFGTQASSGTPDLREGFPTFGEALQTVANYNANNVFWFGKWHLSNNLKDAQQNHLNRLPFFGFNISATPKWPSFYGSPNGTANEGNNGVVTPDPNALTPDSLACDAAIAKDFTDYWATPPSTPWFAAVSFVNPHDIVWYPGFFPPNQVSAGENADPNRQGIATNPRDVNDHLDFLPHDSAFAQTLFSSLPTGFNYETTTTLTGKNLDIQPWFQQTIADNNANGYTPAIVGGSDPNQFLEFLNWYYHMIGLVDQQIFNVLTKALPGYSPTGPQNPSNNTAVIFLSDHGEYGGSHGLHSKAGAVYDEALRVPLYVMLPSQYKAVYRYQMCSMVDIFRFVVELALGNASYNWAGDAVYRDQANRQSLFKFIYQNVPETRMVSINGTQMAYILSTTDELIIDALNPSLPTYNCGLRAHIVCLRTKSIDYGANPPSAFTGAKYSLYSKWVVGSGPTIDGTGTNTQQIEFYDYVNLQNRGELGNNYSQSAPSILQQQMAAALGNGPIGPNPATGLVASELSAVLTGTRAGTPLSNVTALGIADWNTWSAGKLNAFSCQ